MGVKSFFILNIVPFKILIELIIEKSSASIFDILLNISVIEHLPARCKMVFRLVKEDGLKYKQVAAVLNISVKTVENQLAIALKKIASVYQR